MKACPLKQSSKANLADLPVELLEMICDSLLDVGYGIKVACLMWSLRLVCRKINTKLYDYYGRKAFSSLNLHITFPRLQRMMGISQSPFAPRVERLYIFEYDQVCESKKDYDQALATITSLESTRKSRKQAERLIWRADREQDDKAFVERSGALGISLTLSFAMMSNLRKIVIGSTESNRVSLRRVTTGVGESTTHILSHVIASLAHAGLKPYEIDVGGFFGFDTEDAVSLQALSVPPSVLGCLSELRRLHLELETKDNQWYSKCPSEA